MIDQNMSMRSKISKELNHINNFFSPRVIKCSIDTNGHWEQRQSTTSTCKSYSLCTLINNITQICSN